MPAASHCDTHSHPTGKPSEAILEVRLANHEELSSLYGAGFARALIDVVATRLLEAVRNASIEAFKLHCDDENRLCISFIDTVTNRVALLGFCTSIAVQPIQTRAGPVAGVLSLTLIESDTNENARPSDDNALTWKLSEDNDSSLNDGQRFQRIARLSQYKDDNSEIAAFLDSLSSGLHNFFWQPVRRVGLMASISHRELRIGLLDIDGKESCTHSVRLAAERIGASPLIDCMLLSRAIDELLNFPDLSIAVKISPQSAIASFWWSQVFARLEANTTIGPRLLIQISGSSPLPPIGEVTRFFDVARSLGCRLAFDDFGIDHRSIREAVALGPDAIRIPPVFLKRATRGGRDLMIFKQLFGLASAISGLVIVDGVDDEEASNIAAKAGATFQQGRFHGAPTQIRSWGSSYRDTTALRQVSADHAIIPGRPAIPLALS